MNELILLASLFLAYSLILLWHKLFGKNGLYSFIVLATVLANIEVLMIVDAFGLEMTLGNILFSTTFIATDILSENEGKESAKIGVNIGLVAGLTYILITSMWFLYIPSGNDWATPIIRKLFATTPRLVLSSYFVFAVVQKLDVWLYHRIWKKTEKKYGNKEKGLWIRNNLATMTSQLVNAVLYNMLAFYGVFPTKTLLMIILSTFAISIVTSILDTPIVYLARKRISNQ